MAAPRDQAPYEEVRDRIKVRGFPRFGAQAAGVASDEEMARYLVELYRPRSGGDPLDGLAERLADSASR